MAKKCERCDAETNMTIGGLCYSCSQQPESATADTEQIIPPAEPEPEPEKKGRRGRR